MKEIGGYIDFNTFTGEEYHKNAIALNSGRHCLEYLICAKKIKKIYLPYFLCDSVKNICDKSGCEYEYYNIDMTFKPVFDKQLNEHEYIYIVNYYGQLTNSFLEECRERYINIIVDNAQDFFRMPLEGVDTIYTCRKFFGVPDGGYLYTNSILKKDLPVDVSYERIKYILGRFELDAGTFYKDSVENNKYFATETLKSMSKLTHNLLRGFDYEFIIKRRSENFEYLNKKLRNINKLKLRVPVGAFMYPFYTENATEIKKKLINNKIFVPTLWGNVLDITERGTIEYDFAENIIPLPIDQRYDITDMEYILNFI